MFKKAFFTVALFALFQVVFFGDQSNSESKNNMQETTQRNGLRDFLNIPYTSLPLQSQDKLQKTLGKPVSVKISPIKNTKNSSTDQLFEYKYSGLTIKFLTVKNGNPFLVLGVMVSDNKWIKNAPMQLGDSKQKALSILGSPNESNREKNKLKLMYHDEFATEYVSFTFENDTLMEIEWSYPLS